MRDSLRTTRTGHTGTRTGLPGLHRLASQASGRNRCFSEAYPQSVAKLKDGP